MSAEPIAVGEAAHATIAPSGHEMWGNCPGSLALSVGRPDGDSEYSREGTAAHWLASYMFESGNDGHGLIGTNAPNGWPITADMVDVIGRNYVATVKALADGADEFHVEQRVDVTPYVAGCWGTADVIIVRGTELQVHDLKYGMGVEVDAEENGQLMLYALGSLARFDLAYDIDTVRLVIHQPRIKGPTEWTVTPLDLYAFGERANAAAQLALDVLAGKVEPTYNPGRDTCRWCRAKAICPDLAAFVKAQTCGDIEPVADEPRVPDANVGADVLGKAMVAVPLIEDWCRAVRAEVERRLLAGQPVEGFKLVQGRRPARSWTDEAEVERVLKAMRLKTDEMYTYKLASPPAVEKVLKGKPRKWGKLAPLITQGEPSKSVAPVSDKREAIVVTPRTNDIDDLSTDEELI